MIRGRVQKGVVVLDPGKTLPDGTEVEIQPVETVSPRKVGDALASLAGTAIGFPTDLAENHDRHRREHRP